MKTARSTRNSHRLALCLGLCVAADASADQILEIYNDTLTTYRAAASSAQNASPSTRQRGVGIDGALRSPSLFGWSIAGNPFESSGGGKLGGLWLDTGAFGITDVDIALPADVPWPIGRSYNARQVVSGSHHDSNGPQGYNWFQMSMPELVRVEGSTDADDTLWIVYGADRYIEFRRDGSSSLEYKGKNGAAGTIKLVAGSPDVYVYYDQHGNQVYFFGDDTLNDDADWQLWKIVDPAGNVAYAGHETNATTAAADGFDDTLNLLTVAYDSAERRFTYTYSSGDIPSSGGRKRLERVVAETKTGANWSSPGTVTEVARVDYAYYAADGDSYGLGGDLKKVAITTPLSDPSTSLVTERYYRYWDNGAGKDHCIQYIVGPEGTRKFDWQDQNLADNDYETASENDLKPYAEAYFDYTSYQVTTAWFNGECGCGGGVDGQYTISYANRIGFSGGIAGYDIETVNSLSQAAWARRTIVLQPDADPGDGTDANYMTHYFDEVGQPLTTMFTDDDPADTGPQPAFWITKVVRDPSGCVTIVHSPESVTGYTHSSGAFTLASGAGLVNVTSRVSSGDMIGFAEYSKHRQGTGGTEYNDALTSYTSSTLSLTDTSIVRPFVSARRLYHETLEDFGGEDYDETTMSYTYHSSGAILMPMAITTAEPAVGTGNNGRGTTGNDVIKSRRYFRANGTLAFSQRADFHNASSGDLIHDYFEVVEGQTITRVQDAITSGSFDVDPASLGITESGSGADRTTGYAFDPQGRPTETTLPDARVTARFYDKLMDERPVVFSTPDLGADWGGPTQMVVSNQAGKAEASMTIFYDSGSAPTNADEFLVVALGGGSNYPGDPIWELGAWDVTHMRTQGYDDPGSRLERSRVFHLTPTGNGEGADGTNYDETVYGYDDLGRQWRVKDPTGTIVRTVADDRGRIIARYIGTNDNSFTGGEVAASDNMTMVESIQYDGGSPGGNSLVTQRTAIVDETDDGGDDYDDDRVTSYIYDYRNRLKVTVNPQSPHLVNKFDNRGRMLAVGAYSSSSGLDAGDNPTGLSTNRIGLSQNFYDERGLVWKSQRHRILASGGTDDDNLQTLNWFDPQRRAVKTDGGQLTKTLYDRLGRVRRTYILAQDNDSGYADADDVAGDDVVEETITGYESNESDNVLMMVSIARHYDDDAAGTTGDLDTNADGTDLTLTATQVTGRVQITTMYYDALDRVIDSVNYGTNGIVGDGSTATGTLNRATESVPGRSDTRLRTTTAYNDDGTVLDVTDPKALVSRTLYDDAGRTVATIRNYINGTPDEATYDDDDHYTRTVYTDGLMTKLWVDIDGDGAVDAGVDQETIYTYGTAKSGSAGDSRVATGSMLNKVQYPDSSGGSDVVETEYNAQGQVIYRKDQAGNIVETAYDTGGREVHRMASTIAGAFDTTVQRITTAYTSRGQVETVTQYTDDDPTAGSVLDQVKYTHDDWGPVSKFEQDRDGLVGGGGDYEVSYTYAKATTGRNTVRCVTMTLPTGAVLTNEYLSSSDRLDDALSRVTRVKHGTTVVAGYKYTGVGDVVEENLNEANVFTLLHGSSMGDYPRMDVFNRVTDSRWVAANPAPDQIFYRVSIAYDRNSNITTVEDQIHTAGAAGSGNGLFDALYTMDNINRVIRAKEGHLASGTITDANSTRDQQWTLDQLGNWKAEKLDLDGGSPIDWNDAGEYQMDGTFNVANEWTDRDLDTNATAGYEATYALTYDANGNLVDEDQNYELVYDAFNRLVEVENQSSATVTLYRYNGLGHRLSWQYDNDGTAGFNGGTDKTFYFCYDTRWRIVATYRDSDATPKEEFTYHNAGLDGSGGSSYIDKVIMRDKDANTAWATVTTDGVLEERRVHCQNWRGDVSAVVTDTGKMVEWVKYSAYGIPFGLPVGDVNSDGDWDGSDSTLMTGTYDVRKDPDLSGAISGADVTHANSITGGYQTLGRTVMTSASVGNRKGYAGYENDGAIWRLDHVRNRVFHKELGRWTKRDPLGYVDGMSLYEYVGSMAIIAVDPTGALARKSCHVGDNLDGVADTMSWYECVKLSRTKGECLGCCPDNKWQCMCEMMCENAPTTDDCGFADTLRDLGVCQEKESQCDCDACCKDMLAANILALDSHERVGYCNCDHNYWWDEAAKQQCYDEVDDLIEQWEPLLKDAGRLCHERCSSKPACFAMTPSPGDPVIVVLGAQ
jgi:RHS repeat-associated protein